MEAKAEKANRMRKILQISERLADMDKDDIALLAAEVSEESDEVLARLYDTLNEQ